MSSTITLSGDYGYKAYRYNGGDAQAIDATNATWTVANTGSQTNLYPFLVDNGKTGMDIYGTTIDGTVPLTGEWLQLYTNSAAVMVRDTKEADIYDMRISQAWDALRVAGASDGFEISNVWVSDVRDDAFENDNPVSGSISNSLFDGVFSGISLGHKNMADATNEVLSLDGVLMRMESYLFKGSMTHQSPFKMESKSPKLSITDSVIAIDNVNHVGDSRLKMAWDKTIHSSNNVFLNLSDKPLPSDYPMPPAGWTVLQGQQARDYWDAAKADWIATRGEDPEPDATGTPEPETAAPVLPETEQDTGGGAAWNARSLAEGVSVTETGKIILDSTVYTSLKAGPDGAEQTLGAAHFETAARADDYNDHVMYKWKTGELFYDADGNGGGAQVKIGQLDSRLSLEHSDFAVRGEQAPAAGSGTAPETAPETSPETAPETAPEAGSSSGGAWNARGLADGVSVSADGKIGLDNRVYTSLETGPEGQARTLGADHFETAARADDIDDFIMYKWKTGELFYDADGRGGAAQVKIGQLDSRLSLDHSDFVVSGEQAPAAASGGSWSGEEIFAFDALPQGGQVREIRDFDPGSDKFVFDSAAFTALQDQGSGLLEATHFEIAARADDYNDHIMYKWKTGELFYDADGRGGADQVKVAQLDAQMAMDHSDFLVI